MLFYVGSTKWSQNSVRAVNKSHLWLDGRKHIPLNSQEDFKDQRKHFMGQHGVTIRTRPEPESTRLCLSNLAITFDLKIQIEWFLWLNSIEEKDLQFSSFTVAMDRTLWPPKWRRNVGLTESLTSILDITRVVVIQMRFSLLHWKAKKIIYNFHAEPSRKFGFHPWWKSASSWCTNLPIKGGICKVFHSFQKH